MTINEAERCIENAYRDGRFLRKSQVTINVEGYAPREVTIGDKLRSRTLPPALGNHDDPPRTRQQGGRFHRYG